MAVGRTAVALAFPRALLLAALLLASLLLAAAWRSASVVRETQDRLESLERSARLGHLGFATAKLEGLDEELRTALESTAGTSFARPSFAAGSAIGSLARGAKEALDRLDARRELCGRLLELDRRISGGPAPALLLELDALDRSAPQEPWIPFLRAHALAALGDRRAAAQSLEEAGRRAPESPFFQRARE